MGEEPVALSSVRAPVDTELLDAVSIAGVLLPDMGCGFGARPEASRSPAQGQGIVRFWLRSMPSVFSSRDRCLGLVPVRSSGRNPSLASLCRRRESTDWASARVSHTPERMHRRDRCMKNGRPNAVENQSVLTRMMPTIAMAPAVELSAKPAMSRAIVTS